MIRTPEAPLNTLSQSVIAGSTESSERIAPLGEIDSWLDEIEMRDEFDEEEEFEDEEGEDEEEEEEEWEDDEDDWDDDDEEEEEEDDDE